MPQTGDHTTPDQAAPPPRVDSSVAHNARVWNYWLGGKDNFEADRRVGDHVRQMFPVIGEVARADRRFLARAVRHLAGEAGIRQFLDIGTGLPTADNTHDLAQAVAPESRIVYVDNDPMVLVHARALLTSRPEGVTRYLEADVHRPDSIVSAAADTLDLTRPVAVMMLGILNFVLDTDEAYAIVRRLMDAVPPGSYLALTHPTVELGGEANVPAMAFWNEHAAPPIRSRTGAEIAGFLTGLELVEPGLVSCSRWRPDDPQAAQVPQYGAVARKP
ncbi:SAM-dependent methyltransferase [Micromonospora cathayae]|uniref:SAM-dependent methyltransferase n=1 Tax=Micromonospora cathayae TaxID=3028804 RepID=A0ABY7ZJB5_9ACTN|nr:SAM-dependent methyltransferase [Micromonospora sp. HUAS 3]WDZ82967.1 SAM-dependent methyltransferase [Micromonospora sp. HUAS 3]